MRSIALIVRRSLRTHLLSTLLTVISAGFASGLVMSVFSISEQSTVAFTGGQIGYDAVIGAKGSDLQLVLNTVFHLETSPGLIPYSIYKEWKEERGVKYAIPYAVGDNLRGYRVVGTTGAIFDEFEYQKGKRFEFADGGPFHERYMNAVLGATVAKKLGYTVGSSFQVSHGVNYNPANPALHEGDYVVTGVLAPTNTPADQVVWIPIEGIWRMEGHLLADGTEATEHAGKEIPDEQKVISAVMVEFGKSGYGMSGPLAQKIAATRKGSVASVAYPIANVMAGFLQKMDWVTKILQAVAYLVVVVAVFGLIASLYNTMNERRREFAVLRALGARKRTVFSAIVVESATIALLGAALGFLLYLGVMASVAWYIRDTVGVYLDWAAYHPALILTPVGMFVIGALAGVLPAMKAYSTDVARTLA